MFRIRNFAVKLSSSLYSSSLAPSRGCKVFKSQSEEDRNEIESALEIESNLFENSQKNHKPAITSQLLKKKVYSQASKEEILQYSKPKVKLNKFEYTVIDDKVLGLSFTKLKLNDSTLIKLLTTVRSKKRRDKNRQIIIEGRRLILEALGAGLKLQTIIFSQRDELEKISEEIKRSKDNAKIYKVPHHDLKTWSTLTTPPGVLAIFERPSDEQLHLPAEDKLLPIIVICDNIREPNNLGSIIRTCAAIPCQQVIVLKGSCDPWESKALRGGCGAQFRVNIKDDIEWNRILDYLPDKFMALAAENSIDKVKNFKFSNPKQTLITPYVDIEKNCPPYVIIIGGETHGISNEAYEFIDYVGNDGSFIHIPLAEGVESLNTSCALTLILFAIKKQLFQISLNDNKSTETDHK